MHFARQKRTISRQSRTDHVSDTERTYRKGKWETSRSESRERSRAGWQDVREKRGTEKNKRGHICIREKSGKGIEDRDGYIGKIGGHRGTNTIKEADKERHKRRTRRKNEERTDDKNKRNQDSVWD